MNSVIIKVLLSFGFMFSAIGAVYIYSGHSTCKDAAKVEKDWEQVTLQDWYDGKVRNKTLFEVRDFQAGKKYYALEEKYSTDFRMVYIPIYFCGQPEDDGSEVKVVAVVRKAKNEKELAQIFTKPTLKIQDSRNAVPLYAKYLSNLYPRINWSKVKWFLVDDELPTVSEGKNFLMVGWLLVLVSLPFFCFAWVLFRRTLAARIQPLAESAAKMENSSSKRSETGHSTFSAAWHGILPYTGHIANGLILFNLVLGGLLRAKILDGQVVFPILYVTCPVCFGLLVLILCSGFFVAPVLEIERRERAEIPSKSLARLDKEVEGFLRKGFHFVGYSSSRFFGSRKFNAYLLSTDRKCLVEINDNNGKMIAAAVGINDDGFLYSVGKGSENHKIDGTKSGVPIAAKLTPGCSVEETLINFNKFRVAVAESGGHLLEIPARAIFGLMHYEVILVGWWAYQSSLRFTKPESMPSVSEISSDGKTFGLYRDPKLVEAFPEPESLSLLENISQGYRTVSPSVSVSGEAAHTHACY